MSNLIENYVSDSEYSSVITNYPTMVLYESLTGIATGIETEE